MPELAEVEYIRKKWNPGLKQPVTAVRLHKEKRIFRGADTRSLARTLKGARFTKSEARGKQMLFRFAGGGWLGLHLGMTGSLRCEKPGYKAERHDHLVLEQEKQTLVFRDARMFGRVKFHHGTTAPDWWSELPPAIGSADFTLAHLRGILDRRRRAPLKAVLLAQGIFPGVGNWMADEILWQARINPKTLAGALPPAAQRRLWEKTKLVCQVALETIGEDWGDPPKTWLIHYRWKRAGQCPKHKVTLTRETVAGRTTAWCAKCQPG